MYKMISVRGLGKADKGAAHSGPEEQRARAKEDGGKFKDLSMSGSSSGPSQCGLVQKMPLLRLSQIGPLFGASFASSTPPVLQTILRVELI